MESPSTDVDTVARVAGRTMASLGSARSSTAAIESPGGSSAGMSLLLWTATSTVLASRASSISFTKSRLPPTSESETSCSRSPEVLMMISSQMDPVRCSRRAAVVRA